MPRFGAACPAGTVSWPAAMERLRRRFLSYCGASPACGSAVRASGCQKEQLERGDPAARSAGPNTPAGCSGQSWELPQDLTVGQGTRKPPEQEGGQDRSSQCLSCKPLQRTWCAFM